MASSPRVWTYLLKQYVAVFLTTAAAICLLLFVARFQEIAKFISTTSSIKMIAKFLLFQIPHLIPYSFFVAALIASFAIARKISTSHEVTALRMAGLSLSRIFTPFRYAALSIAMVCGFVTFSYKPYSKVLMYRLLDEVKSRDPFVLLQNSTKELSSDMKAIPCDDGMVVGIRNPQSNTIDLFLAQEVESTKGRITAKNMQFISVQEDGTIVENVDEMKTEVGALSQWVSRNSASLGKECVSIAALFHAFWNDPIHEQTVLYTFGQGLFFPLAIVILSEAATYAGFTFSRKRNSRSTILFFLLLTFSIIGFLTGKSLEDHPPAAFASFLVPLAVAISLNRMRYHIIERGIE